MVTFRLKNCHVLKRFAPSPNSLAFLASQGLEDVALQVLQKHLDQHFTPDSATLVKLLTKEFGIGRLLWFLLSMRSYSIKFPYVHEMFDFCWHTVHSIFIDFPQTGDHHPLDGMMFQVFCGELEFLVVLALVIPNLCKYCMYLEPPMTPIFKGQPPQKQALFQPKMARSIVQQRVGCTWVSWGEITRRTCCWLLDIQPGTLVNITRI